MVVQRRISTQAYLRLALRDPDGHWELHHGTPWEKPGMSFTHNHLWLRLSILLDQQLDRDVYEVGANGGRVRISADQYYIPDVFVVPVALTTELRQRADILEAYEAPLPLVVEVWSPSTGAYDIAKKVAGYQQRGDQEIWHIHPYDKTLTAWRRQPDGTYTETSYRGGPIEPASLPGVVIDLDALLG